MLPFRATQAGLDRRESGHPGPRPGEHLGHSGTGARHQRTRSVAVTDIPPTPPQDPGAGGPGASVPPPPPPSYGAAGPGGVGAAAWQGPALADWPMRVLAGLVD